MRFAASWTVVLFVAIFDGSTASGASVKGALVNDEPPQVIPAGATFRFSDEEPPWEMARPNSAHSTFAPACQGGSDGKSESGFLGRRLLAAVAHSDPCFADFLGPVTNPFYFENPRTVTEARLIFLHQAIPASALGGNLDVLALQLRAALTDRLSIIATNNGFAAASSPVIEDGWADVNVGLKYSLLADSARQRLLSVGMTYELPVGSTRSYQGNGEGVFNLFATGGMEVGNWHAISAAGLLLPADRSAESSWAFWSQHLSRRVGCSNWHVLGELNWFHYMSAGEGSFPLAIEGGDIFNFGSVGVAGNNIVTGAVGLRYKPADSLEIGVAWETPLTSRRDLLDNRLTVDCIFRY